MRRRWQPALKAAALADAILTLDLTDPVRIEGLGPDGPAGYYRRENGAHTVFVAFDLTPREISRTIWHELAHAMQCEEDFAGDGKAYHQAAFAEAVSTALDDDGPLEREAQAAEDFDYDIRLVRMAKV